jgi:alpha-L-rhamnosidase
LQTTSPSWLGQVDHGATTIWETWEGYKADGRADRSHNHYAFGAVAQFLHEHIAGLQPAAPGYRRLRIAPMIGGGLNHASSTIETPYGTARSAWRLDGEVVTLEVTVPIGTEADIVTPDGLTRRGSGSHVLSFVTDDTIASALR